MIHFVEVMSKYHQACFDFSKAIKNILSKNYSLFDDTPSTWNNSMKSFIKCLSNHSQLFLQTSENIKTVITDPILKSLNEHSQKEKENYNTYSKSRSIYNNLKSSLDKIHKEFEQRAKECENLVYNTKKAKLHNLVNQEQLVKMDNKATEALTSTAICEDKYMNTLTEANKARENETLLQKKSHSFYETCDSYYYNQIKSDSESENEESKEEISKNEEKINEKINEKEENINKEKKKKEIIKIKNNKKKKKKSIENSERNRIFFIKGNLEKLDSLDYCDNDECDGIIYFRDEENGENKYCSNYFKTGCKGK